MTLDFDTCYRAVLARDTRFDGRFFTGVTSTGTYCRPICPARTPARRNVRFFPHAGAAEAAGFRACRRCRPEASPGSPDWNTRADLAARAVRLICDGYVDEHGVCGLASRLAVSDRHLRRLLLAELGATPLALARTTRLQTARRLLAETGMPVTDIAFASGFASVRQFNASFQRAYGRAPSVLRARPPVGGQQGVRWHGRGTQGQSTRGVGAASAGNDPPGTSLTLRLACREPFDGRSLLKFLAARAIPGVEEVSGNRYTRTIRTPGGPGIIELTLPAGHGAGGEPRAGLPSGHGRHTAGPGTAGPGTAGPGTAGPGQVRLQIRLTGIRGVGQVVSRCRHLLDLDADPLAIEAVLAADPTLAPLVALWPGLRVPGAYDGFELAVRAVLGQQVSVGAARTFAARVATRYGTRVGLAAGPAGPATGPGRPMTAGGTPALLFPGPGDLAEADLSGLGLTAARQATLRALSQAVTAGRIGLDPGADPEETAARLGELPGIGPWTIAYVLMRALHDPDAYPETDLGLRRALARLGGDPGRSGLWRPWRAYATLHLWTWHAGACPTTTARE